MALVNLATLTWSSNMVLGRALREDIGPLTLAASRFLIACAIFVALLQRQPRVARRLHPDRSLLIAMGICGATFAPALYLGLRHTSAVNATLINGLGPLITGLLAAPLIGEPMSRRQLTGALAGLVGIVILISHGSLALWERMRGSPGDIIVLGALSLWSLYSVLGRRVMGRRSALSTTALSMLVGLPLLLIGTVWELQRFPVDISRELLLAILYIGVAPTVIGFLSWNAGVRRLGASGAMVFYNTLPLYGSLLAYLFLGESVGPTHLAGGLLIVGGGLWAARGQAGRSGRPGHPINRDPPGADQPR
jgi:drug/metabolite transporter (DMT)-like permease